MFIVPQYAGDPDCFIHLLTIPLSQSLGMVMSTKSPESKIAHRLEGDDATHSALIPTPAPSDGTGRQKCQKTFERNQHWRISTA